VRLPAVPTTAAGSAAGISRKNLPPARASRWAALTVTWGSVILLDPLVAV